MNTKSYIASAIVAMGIATYGNNTYAQSSRLSDKDFDNDRNSYALDLASLKDYNSKKEPANEAFVAPMGNGIGVGIRIRDFSWEGLKGIVAPVKLWDHDKKGDLRVWPFGFHPFSEGGFLSILNSNELKNNPGRAVGTLFADAAIVYGLSKAFGGKNDNHEDYKLDFNSTPTYSSGSGSAAPQIKTTPTDVSDSDSGSHTHTPRPEVNRLPGNGNNNGSQGNQPELPVAGSSNNGSQPELPATLPVAGSEDY